MREAEMHATLEEVQLRSRKPIDGWLKVAFPLALAAVSVAAPPRVQILVFGIFSALSAYAAGRRYIWFLKVPAAFVVPGAIAVALVVPGEHFLTVGPIAVSYAGVRAAAETLLRSATAVSCVAYLVLTTTVPEFVSTLKKMKIPDFVAEILLLVYRGIQVLFEEAERLDAAAAARLGYAGWRSFIGTTAMLAHALFLKSLRRAETIEMSMAARCYSGRMPVVEMRGSGFGIAAASALAVIAAWIA